MRKWKYDMPLRLFGVLSLALLPGTAARAQGEWDEATEGILSLYDAMGNLLMVVMGVGALVVLVMIVLKIMKGEKESAEKLAWWILGLAFGFTMMAFLKA